MKLVRCHREIQVTMVVLYVSTVRHLTLNNLQWKTSFFRDALLVTATKEHSQRTVEFSSSSSAELKLSPVVLKRRLVMGAKKTPPWTLVRPT